MDDVLKSAGGAPLRAVQISKQHGVGQAAVTALDQVSVSVAAGRFTVVSGPSGSGKSTLLYCLAGLEAVDSGQVYVGGTELGSLREPELTLLRRNRIGFVFQSFNLLPTLTAAENLLLPLRIARRAVDRVWVDRLVDTVGLRDRLGHRPSEMSGGQQQRLAVARALVSRPAVVFADEPTGNLDSAAGAQVLQLLRRAVDEFGQTVVMVSHDPVAAGYADRAVVLSDGRVVDEMDVPSAGTVRAASWGQERAS